MTTFHVIFLKLNSRMNDKQFVPSHAHIGIYQLINKYRNIREEKIK